MTRPAADQGPSLPDPRTRQPHSAPAVSRDGHGRGFSGIRDPITLAARGILGPAPIALSIVVPGRPVPWQRARTNSGRHYTAPAVAAHKSDVAWRAKEACRKPIAGPLSVEIRFTYELPKRPTTTEPTGRPDIDNLGKLVLDALSGIAWIDDAQVVELHQRKQYGPRAATIISIRSLDAIGKRAER